MTTKHKHATNSDLYHDVEKIKAALMMTALDVKDKASDTIFDTVETVKEKSDLARDTVADYTAEKPFKSLGIALLVGIGIGYLLKK